VGAEGGVDDGVNDLLKADRFSAIWATTRQKAQPKIPKRKEERLTSRAKGFRSFSV